MGTDYVTCGLSDGLGRLDLKNSRVVDDATTYHTYCSRTYVPYEYSYTWPRFSYQSGPGSRPFLWNLLRRWILEPTPCALFQYES